MGPGFWQLGYEPMTDAELYCRTHALLRSAKLARWKISRTAADAHWRSPSGAAVTIAARPTMRALLAAELGFERIERANTEVS